VGRIHDRWAGRLASGCAFRQKSRESMETVVGVSEVEISKHDGLDVDGVPQSMFVESIVGGR